MRSRRRLLFGLIAVALIAAGAVAAAVVVGEGRFAGIGKEHRGDSDVVAVVGDVEVLRREVRISTALSRVGAPEWSADEVSERVIVGVVDEGIQYAEARRRGLEVSLEEAEAHRDSMREHCYGPEGQECRDFIDQLGVPEDEYWEQVVSGYRRGLSKVKLMQAVFKENGLWAEATNEELVAFEREYVKGLRDTTPIVWKDPGLERTYHQAQRQRK